MARRDPIHVATEESAFLLGEIRQALGRILARHRAELSAADATDIEAIAQTLETIHAQLDAIDRYLRARRGEYTKDIV